MQDDYGEEADGLLGPREWLIIGVVLFVVYLYKKSSHRLCMPSSGFMFGLFRTERATLPPQNTSGDDDAQRRHILEARRRLIEEAERNAEVNRAKMKVSRQ